MTPDENNIIGLTGRRSCLYQNKSIEKEWKYFAIQFHVLLRKS